MRRHLLIAFAAAVAATMAPEARAQDFHALWVVAPGDIWVAGESGTLIHGSGGSWVRMQSGAVPGLNGIWGIGPRDIWIVGDEGIILHWDGAALTSVNSGTRSDLAAVFGCAANDVYAVGQSSDNTQPPVVTHWNGTSWTPQRLSLPFRPVGIAGACPDLVIAGTAFFDPKPDERRNVGVVARMQGGAWVLSGWNGQRVTDEQFGSPWSGVTSARGMVLLRGGGEHPVLLLGSRGSWTRLPAATGNVEAALLAGDGTPVVIRREGFDRLVGGQWHSVGQTATTQSPSGPATAMDTAAMTRLTARADAITRSVPRGGNPTAAQIQELSQISMQIMQLQMGGQNMQQYQQRVAAQVAQAQAAGAAGERNSALSFGERPPVFGGPGGDFYVAGRGNIMHVSGDASRIVFDMTCVVIAPGTQLPRCHADGGPGPGPAPAPLVAPTLVRAAPDAAPATTPPSRTPSLPSIRPPKVRIPRP